MVLPFPTPPSVKVLIAELEQHGFTPRVELAAGGRIVVSVEAGRVAADAVFRRRGRGYVPVTGSMLVDGLACSTVTTIAELRKAVDDPDGHLAKRKPAEPPPPHVRWMLMASSKKDNLRSVRAL